MEGYELLTDLVLAVLAAMVGGFIAHWLKLPVIIGYLLAGILVGPFTPGPVSDIHRVQTMAELGVALLMFALGSQFSLAELGHVGKGAIGGGVLQIILTIALGVPVGTLLLGLNLVSSIYFGGLMALSSSIVILKVLMSRGELDSKHGKLALGTGVVQDISVVVLVVVLPALAISPDKGGAWELALAVLLALGKAILFLGTMYLVGTRAIPSLLRRVISVGVRELFLLVIITIAVGTALLANLVGLSFALGAFLAGMVVAESDASADVLNEIIPIRDVFATLFFVSIGMLIDPLFVWKHLVEVLIVVMVILVGKFTIIASTYVLLRYPLKTALLAGLLLAQIGEFSFVLAKVGVERGAIDERLKALTLAGALITIIVNPILYQVLPPLFAQLIASKLGQRLSRWKSKGVAVPKVNEAATETFPIPASPLNYNWPGRDPQLDSLMELEVAPRDQRSATEQWPYKKHAIICGYGRVGRELVEALLRRNLKVVLIEYDPRRATEARAKGLMVLEGDAAEELTLKQANLSEAKVLAITTPDIVTAEAATRAAHRVNPNVEVITRSSEPWAILQLKQAGATAVVQPEIEASLEFIRRSLRAYGVNGVELQSVINGRRTIHYGGS
ncbi:MAG: cation:proton antiporter [Chloroflexota bacterium]|nr:cation:proton antiporter [Chloroflexota bacterium]